ncbi:MAG: phospho-sugar mutase [Clostridia bacterium]|nr:phospho-sugar mutase [Clostridia bacterium]
MNAQQEFVKWLSDDIIDLKTKDELRRMSAEEVNDAFYKELSFGTGGLRGVIGVGTNRMNIYTVGKATQGLANYILKHTDNKKVVIAYDSRNMSAEFALSAALVLNANGIEAYLFESLRPTPELSFAVRYLGCTAGIVVTASHNPPEYNGYKVYWEDGAQITAPRDRDIIAEVNAVKDYSEIKRMEKGDAELLRRLHIIGEEVDNAYLAELKKLVLDPEVIKEMSDEIKIVYTPLHGSGNVPVCRLLAQLGFNKVTVVPQQEKPDGNFPTVAYPNPEDPKAFALALELAEKVDADIVLATDPDADRLGVYAKDKSGNYVSFTGNMSGLLIAEYQLARKEEKGLLPKNRADGALVTTIVSSNMAEAICKAYGITRIETLTGFKYIGEQIKLFEEAKAENGGKLDASKGAYEYLFGYEESYGCLVGTHARDKDACVAVMALAEAAAYYKSKGLTLWEQMLNIYKKYGFYKEELASITLKGEDGSKKIVAMMDRMRNEPPKTIGGLRVLALRDYENDVRNDLMTGEEGTTGLPKSNVLYYELENNGWCCIRPSGTEPKIKFYFGAKGETMDSVQKIVSAVKEDLLALANR